VGEWEWGMRLNRAKKEFQKKFRNSEYSLYGIASYTLTEDDLTKDADNLIKEIFYFRHMKKDDLAINLNIILLDNSCEQIIGIARKADEILDLNNIINLRDAPNMATNIGDAKRRYDAAVADFMRDFGLTSSGINKFIESGLITFMFFKWVEGIDLQTFLSARELLYAELRRISKDADIVATLTSDTLGGCNYGCFITISKQLEEMLKSRMV